MKITHTPHFSYISPVGEDQIYPVLGWRAIPLESSILSAVTLLALFLSQGFYWALMEVKLLFRLCLQTVREDKRQEELRREKERKRL